MSETSNNQADIRARRRFPWVAGLVLVVGLVLSVHIFYVVRMSEQLEAEQLLERKADAVQAVISERMTRFNLTGLYLRRALWWVKREDVERFNRIAESILRRYPELQAIELSLIIGAAEREAFEKLGREFVKPDYQITEPDADGRLVPAGEREKYCPIFFVRPIEGNRVAAGLDLFKAASAPVVVRTLEAGGLKASPPIRLVQETTESMGVVLYGALYEGTVNDDDAEVRLRQARGIVQIVLLADRLFDSLLATVAATEMDVLIMDRRSGPESKPLFYRPAAMRERPIAVPLPGEIWSGTHLERRVLFGGREWQILFRSSPEFLAAQRTLMPWGALLSGLAFTLLLTGYVLDQGKRTGQIEQTVTQRTVELRESRALYHSLVENLPQYIFRKDREGRFTFVNQQLADLMELPADKIVGKCDADFSSAEMAAKYRADDLQVMSTGEPLEVVEENDFGAETIYVHTSKAPLRNEHGEVIGIQGIAWDISERHQLQQALSESEERMRLFIRHTPTSVAMFDTEMRYLLASRRWYEDNHWENTEIVGRSHYELVPDVPARWREIHQRCLGGGSDRCEEDEFARRDGSVDYVRWEIHPWHTVKGQIGGIIMFAETITDRVSARKALRRSEAILHATGQAAGQFLKATEWETVVPDVLRQLGEATGVSRVYFCENEKQKPGAPVTHRRFEWLSAKAPGPGFESIDFARSEFHGWAGSLVAGEIFVSDGNADGAGPAPVLAGQAIVRTLQIPIFIAGRWWGSIGFDDCEKIHSWSAAEREALKGAAGNLAAAIERQLAVRERLDLERKLQDSQRLESMGVLAGGVAHDFNNLLTAIIGNAGLARMDIPADSGAVESIDVIEKTAMRAADLCNQMLAYAGKGRFQMKSLDLNTLIRDTTELLKLSISKKASLTLELHESLPAVRADESQLRQIIMNLVINASEALEDRPGTITVSSDVHELNRAMLDTARFGEDLEEGRYVCISVKDTGSGMSEETLRHVFEPFYTTRFAGRGLGLAAVMGIVRGHRGALKANSQEGAGSEFILILPVIRIRETQPGNAENDGWELFSLAGKKVLLVDDEQAVLIVAKRTLLSLKMRVETAVNGREAVEKFVAADGDFDVVLMDLTMPEIDGIEALGRMRELRPEVRVVLMSGYDERNTGERYEGAGVTAFLQKPFQLSTLRETLEEVLADHRNEATA